MRQLRDLRPYNRSRVEWKGTAFFLVRSGESGSMSLGVEGDATGFEGPQSGPGGIRLYPLTAANCATLRARLPWLRPVPLGLRTSAGFGDRLGLATPGHVQAIRRLPEGGRSVGPVFAQQSVRENSRTGRTPQEVLDDATWGLFQEGWRSEWGADADHLKTPEAVDEFTAAGYTMYTVDPGDLVDDEAASAGAAEVESRVRALPWEVLDDSPGDLERRYLSGRWGLEGVAETVDRETILRAAAKYGHAVGHAVTMYRCLASRMEGGSFEMEVSVDETASPTSVVEHAYIATELRRLGVQWVGLAPRFVGRFEKGVDYIGDLGKFSTQFRRHAAVAKALGPYKLSLHSGSDKFSIYSLTAGASTETPEVPIHLKTAGTSYLEALRTVAQVDSSLFREILDCARERYREDRATYHVSARAARVPPEQDLTDDQLSDLLDQFDARQVLHVTFGSVLDRFQGPLLASLRKHEEVHQDLLANHFERHLRPFVG